MGLISELRRRNVFRVAIAYAVVAWLILQVGDTLSPALRLPEWVNTVLAYFLIVGFPIALVFAWAYELTPAGLKKDKEVERSESIAHVTGRRLDFIIIAVLVLALGYFAVDKYAVKPSGDAERSHAATDQPAAYDDTTQDAQSIAVLAFADLSPGGDQEYFSDGISEEILNALAKVPGLNVTSRSSAFSLKDKGLDIPAVASKLGVANILDGSVRKSGNRVRITAQLIDVQTDTHIWSDNYDRELDDIFAVQDEISAAIVAALQLHLGLTIESAPKVTRAASVEAYQLYLQGRHFWRRRNVDDLLRAEQILERAVALDPEFAGALVALAATYAVIPSYVDVDPSDYVRKASEAAHRALELDPTHAEAYAVLSNIANDGGNWAESFRFIEKAIELDPKNATAHHWAYIGYISTGRLDDAHRSISEAYRLDPLNAAIAGSLAWSHSVAGEFDAAIRMLEVSEKLGWGDFAPPYIALNYALKGDTKKAAELYASFGTTRDFANFDWAPSFLEALMNPQHVDDFVETIVDAVVAGEADPKSVYPMLALVGSERFKDIIYMSPGDRTYIWALWYQRASAARKTPAFRELVSDLRMLDYWRESDQWPDLCRPDDSGALTCD